MKPIHPPFTSAHPSPRRFFRRSLAALLLAVLPWGSPRAADLWTDDPASTNQIGFLYWSTAGELPGGPVNSQVKRLRFGSTNVTTVLTTPVSFRFGGIAFDPANGHLYSGDGSTLFRTTLDGADRTVLVPNTTVTDLELDLAGGKVYWSDTTRDLLYRANLDGSDQETIRTLNFEDLVEGLAIDPAGGKVYLAYNTSPAASQIQVMNLDGSGLGIFKPLMASTIPFDTEIDLARGRLYWNQVGPVGTGIWRANLDGSDTPQLIHTSPHIINNGMHYDPVGDHFYYSTTFNDATQTDLHRVNSDGTNPLLILHEPGRPNYLETLHGMTIRSQPLPQTVRTGATVTFAVGATGIGALAYQWQFNGTAIPGANSATLTLLNATAPQAGAYSVVVTDQLDSVTSANAILSFLDLRMFAGLNLTGPVGAEYLIEYRDSVSMSGAWQTLTNVILPHSPYLQLDYDSPNHPKRFYRATPRP